MKFRPFNSIIAKRREDIVLNDGGQPHAYEIIDTRLAGELMVGTVVAACNPCWLDDGEKIVALSLGGIVAIIDVPVTEPEPTP